MKPDIEVAFLRQTSRRLSPCLFLLAVLASASLALGDIDELSFLPGWEHVLELRERATEASGWVALPATFSRDAPTKIENPAGYSVHLIAAENPALRYTEPAGEPFLPRPGTWRIFLEGKWSISPFSTVVVFHEGAREYLSIRALPVVPAGRVALPANLTTDRPLELRLLSATTAPGLPRHELSRRHPISEVDNGVLMPAGRVVAALWDPRQERYQALSRTFFLGAGESIPAPVEHPSATTSFLVLNAYLARGASVRLIPGLKMTVEQRGRKHPADTTIVTAWGIYSIWYGLSPGRALVLGGNDHAYLEPTAVELRPGEISRMVQTLVKRPFTEDR